MLVHHSLRDPNRGASARTSTGSDLIRNDSTRPGSGGRSSPLKFFASSSTRSHPNNTAEPPGESQVKEQEPIHPQKEQGQQPGALQKRWTVDYLAELRKPVGARPMGARPPPGRNSVGSMDLPPRATSALAGRASERETERADPIEKLKRSISPFGSQRSSSALSHRRDIGRPLARVPDASIMEDIATVNAKADRISVEIDGQKSPMPYYERGQRWMEKQEAKSLRAAMEYMDLNEEKRVHEAAQEEAADLVWKHKYPEKPYENPEAFKDSIKQHLRQGSHARSQSIGPFSTLYVTKGGATDGKRSASDGSTSNKSDSSNEDRGNRVVSTSSKGSNGSSSSSGSRRQGSLGLRSSAGRIFGSIKNSRRSRKSSNGRDSGLFRNPTDRIYEEPESIIETSKEEQQEPHTVGPLKPKTRNPSGSHRPTGPKDGFSVRPKLPWESRKSAVDIHKNPPSQSRDAKYVRNAATEPQQIDVQDQPPPTKNGIEIRSEEIRAATSRKLKDRSDSLPRPTYVSDSPGRPIVSFETGYMPRDTRNTVSGRPGSRDAPLGGARPMPGKPPMPVATASAPVVPKINTPAPEASRSAFSSQPSVPQISVSNDQSTSITCAQPAIPSIAVDDVPSINVGPSRVMPQINISQPSVPTISIGGPEPQSQPAARPAGPPHTKTAPASNPVLRGHWSPAAPRVGGAACCTCGLHIQGRTLSAAGQRFHPACFNCFQCGTNLEHVAFYPEPDNAREERFAQENADVISRELDQRFFCHLDFHELFSPRCKSCKTPIEGEVILACGAQWHQGHFFCAQCGDPFDGSTPFIEKDGWAWCVGCYKGRYSGKCRGCKKPVIEDGVKALGAEWHADCFRCKECNGPFEDGKFFTRGAGEVPVCVLCEERRLKA